MTTVAANLEMMVADSQVSDGDQKWPVRKIERIGDALVATAGDASEGERFYDWMRKGRRGKKPVVSESFSALVLNDKGLFFWDSGLYPQPLQRGFHAIGSGGKAATAAWLAGATIERAVSIVCEIDAGSSLPVQIVRLKEEE